MGKCVIGPKKLAKIQAILDRAVVPYKVYAALTRGGWPHGDAQCFVFDTLLAPDHPQYNKIIYLNYFTGEVEPWQKEGLFSLWTGVTNG